MQLKHMQTIAGTCLAYLAEAMGMSTPDGSCLVDVVNKLLVVAATKMR